MKPNRISNWPVRERPRERLIKEGTLMRIPSSVTGLLLYGLIFGCAPTIPPVTPPESYKGPVAEQPVVRPGEYWVYQTGSLNKGKTTALPANLGFPLWLGK